MNSFILITTASLMCFEGFAVFSSLFFIIFTYLLNKNFLKDLFKEIIEEVNKENNLIVKFLKISFIINVLLPNYIFVVKPAQSQIVYFYLLIPFLLTIELPFFFRFFLLYLILIVLYSFFLGSFLENKKSFSKEQILKNFLFKNPNNLDIIIIKFFGNPSSSSKKVISFLIYGTIAAPVISFVDYSVTNHLALEQSRKVCELATNLSGQAPTRNEVYDMYLECRKDAAQDSAVHVLKKAAEKWFNPNTPK